MTYHFVAKAETESHQKVVLKIGFDKNLIESEKKSLMFFNGEGAVGLIDFNDEYNAILIEQAIPGYALKSIYPDQFEVAICAYSETIHKLHNKKLPVLHSFPYISDWLKAIDEANKDKLPRNLMEKAIKLKNKLLNTISNEKLLHGDLHHDNILQQGNEWVVIDPKGVVGDIEFEAAAFDFITISELANQDAKEIMYSRIEQVARKSNLKYQRLIDWTYVRLILMSVWMIEDNGEPTRPIKMAELLYDQ